MNVRVRGHGQPPRDPTTYRFFAHPVSRTDLGTLGRAEYEKIHGIGLSPLNRMDRFDLVVLTSVMSRRSAESNMPLAPFLWHGAGRCEAALSIGRRIFQHMLIDPA
jgi:hypothetical protein